MKIRVVNTPPAKPDVPFVVGGVYRHKATGLTLVPVRLLGEDGKYRLYNVHEGYVGYPFDSDTLAFLLGAYVYVPDAELVVPSHEHDN